MKYFSLFWYRVKPCPKCKEQKKIKGCADDSSRKYTHYFIKCLKCGYRAISYYYEFRSKQQAVDEWNSLEWEKEK